MKKILVSGKNGQLGSELEVLSQHHPEFEWLFTDRTDFDLGKGELLRNTIARFQPDWVINCAAYTAVDKAETDRETAMAINAVAPGIIAESCKLCGAALVHISTDYVFNGEGKHPYTTDETTDPVNFYGATKRAGEEKALAANDKTIIIRTAWVYSSFGKNFVKTMRTLMSSRPQINVVSDQVGTPTYARDLAEAILAIISAEKQYWGIYHFSNEGEISWYDFAVAIAQLSGLDCKVNPIPTSEFPTPAKRPSYSVLDKEKIKENYHIPLKYWVNSLKECLALLDEPKS